jgi:hypothetical protein
MLRLKLVLSGQTIRKNINISVKDCLGYYELKKQTHQLLAYADDVNLL